MGAVAFTDLITFTRSTGGGRFNASGQYEWLATDQPRFDYDPVTGEAKGLLIEEQRTNLLTYSSDFANAAWGKANSLVNTSAAVAPDGSMTASKLIEDSTTGVHSVFRTFGAAVIGTAYTSSLFVKSSERTSVHLRLEMDAGYYGAKFDLSTGSVTEIGAGITATAVPAGNGWYRCAITRTATSAGTVRIYNYIQQVASYAGDGTSGIYIWGAQLEAGSSPSSYIPTTNAQVTRAADIASVNELSPWYRADEWTLFVEYSAPSTIQTDAGVWWLNRGVALCGASLRANSDADRAVAIARSSVALNEVRSTVSGAAAGVTHKSSVSVDAAGGVSISVDGSSVASSHASVIELDVNRLQLGYQSAAGRGRYLNGHIRSLRFYPRRLSDTELQALTA